LRYYVSLLAPAYKGVRQIVESLRNWEVPVEVIAPANGVIWRADPADILSAYTRWTDRLPEKRGVVVYETMLKSTEYMAEAVARGITAEGIPCSLRRVSLAEKEDILAEIFRAAAVLLGSPTVHRGILPSLAPLLQSVRSLGLRGRIGSAFGSYGWSGESRTQLERQLQECGISVAEKGVYAAMRPSSADLQRCNQLGRRIAARLKPE
jgi:flavorubredoxin